MCILINNTLIYVYIKYNYINIILKYTIYYIYII